MERLNVQRVLSIVALRRRELLLSASILASFTGYARMAYAQVVCSPAGSPSYLCSGSSASTQTITASDAQVVASGSLSVDTTVSGGSGGSAITISGDGHVSFRDAPGATVTLTGAAASASSGLSIVSTGDLAGVPGTIAVTSAGTFRGHYGIYAWSNGVGGTGDVTIALDGVAEGIGPDSDGIAAGRVGGTGDLTITTGATSRVTGDHAGIFALATTTGTTRITVDGYASATNGGSISARSLGDLEITTGATSLLKGQTGIRAEIGTGKMTVDLSGDIDTVAGAFGVVLVGGGQSTGISFTTRAGSTINSADSVIISNSGRGDSIVDIGGYILPTGSSSRGIHVQNNNTLHRSDILVTTQVGSWVRGANIGISAVNSTPEGKTTVITHDDVWATRQNAISVYARTGAGDIVVETNSSTPNRTVHGAKYGITVNNSGIGSTAITVNNEVYSSGGSSGYTGGAIGIVATNRATSQNLAITVNSTGTVRGYYGGIYGLNEGTGNTTVTIDGTVKAANANALLMKNMASAGDLTLVTGVGSQISGRAGASVINYGTGSTTVTVDGDMTGTDESGLRVLTHNGLGSTINVGSTATIASSQAAGLYITGAADVTVSGQVSSATGAAIQFDPTEAVDDRLELQQGWSFTGHVDAGAGEDSLEFGGNIAAVYDVGTMQFGATDGDFRNFEWIKGTTAATGTLSVAGTSMAFDANAAALDVVIGNGTLDAIGSAQSFTVESGGRLFVAEGQLEALTVYVGAGGLFGGAGTFAGDVDVVAGILSPGNAPFGTLTIDGSLTLDAASTLEVQVGDVGQSDRVVITQTADLAGRVAVEADPGVSYRDPKSFTILTAGGGLNGSFSSAVLNGSSAFITPTLSQSGTDVVLTVSMADFAGVATNSNQQQVARAFNDLGQSGDALAVYTAFADLDAESARRALDLASGEIHLTGQQVIDETFALFSHDLGRRHAQASSSPSFDDPLGYAAKPEMPAGIAALLAPELNPTEGTAWIAPFAGRGVIEAGSAVAGQDWSIAGLSGGYESATGTSDGALWAGFGFGYVRSQSAVPARLSSLDADSMLIGIYGGQQEGPWTMSGALTYGASQVDTQRRIVFGGIDRTASADYLAHALGLSVEAAFAIELGTQTTLSPLAALYAGWSGHGGFTETGADALNLASAGESRMQLDTGLGLALQHTITSDTAAITLGSRVMWEHDFTGGGTSQLALAGSPTGFTISDPDAARDKLRMGIDVTIDFNPALTLGAHYNGVFSENQNSHTGSVDLKLKF